MFAKSHVFLPALALTAAFALPLAVHAGETPDPQAAIRAQILGTWKGQPVTGSAVVDGGVLDTRERARRGILGLELPKVAVPLIAVAPESLDSREQARRQILGQPTAGSAVRAELVVAR
jgi:hypothetical protein